MVIEDSPYREVRFEGESQKMLYDLDDSNRVVTLGTFSKIFVPGFRLGWMMGPEEIIQKVVIAKQSADLCTSVFVQKIAAKYIKKGFFEAKSQEDYFQLPRKARPDAGQLQEIYARRCNMDRARRWIVLIPLPARRYGC